MLVAGYWMGVQAGGLNPAIRESIVLYDPCGLPFGRIHPLSGMDSDSRDRYAWSLEMETQHFQDLRSKLENRETVTVRFRDQVVAIGN